MHVLDYARISGHHVLISHAHEDAQQGIENFANGCKGPHSSRTGKVVGRVDIFLNKKGLRFLKLEKLTFSTESKIWRLLDGKSSNSARPVTKGLFLFGKIELLPNADKEAFLGPQKPR